MIKLIIVFMLFIFFFIKTLTAIFKYKKFEAWLKKIIIPMLKIAIHGPLIAVVFLGLMFVIESILFYYGKTDYMFYYGLYRRARAANPLYLGGGIFISVMSIFTGYMTIWKFAFKNYMRYSDEIPTHEGRKYHIQNYGWDLRLRTWAGVEVGPPKVWFSMSIWNIFLPLRALYTIRDIQPEDYLILWKILSEKIDDSERDLSAEQLAEIRTERKKAVKELLISYCKNRDQEQVLNFESDGFFNYRIYENGRRYMKPNSSLDLIIIPPELLEAAIVEYPDAEGASSLYRGCLRDEVSAKRQAAKGDTDIVKRSYEKTSITFSDAEITKMKEVHEKVKAAKAEAERERLEREEQEAE